MPINLPYIQPLSFEQNNPLAMGVKEGQGIYSNFQDALAKSLAMQKTKAELPYAGDIAKANSIYKIAMANYLSSPGKYEQGMTPLGKALFEKNRYGIGGNEQGYQSTGDPVQDAYNLYVQKMTTDTQTRNRNLFASNIEKTIKFINPDDLTQYSGIKGKFNQALDAGQSAFGKAPENYQRYLKSLQAATLMAKQVRQFYGDSIQPDMELKLQQLTNPSLWSNDPDTAKDLFNQTKELLGQELETYRQALKSTSPYESQDNIEKTNSNETQEPVYNKSGVERLSKGLQLPKFNSQSEFKEWYKRQPKITKDAIRKSLGG